MTKTYFLETLCVQKDSNNKVVEKFLESGFVFVTDAGIIVSGEFSNDLEVFKTMKEFKMSFVHKLSDFKHWCKLTHLGEL